MSKHPLDIIKQNDNEFFSHLSKARDIAFSKGKIPEKYKFLITLALDASHGAVEGVKSLALQAMDKGVTKEEIMETLKLTYYISGIGSIYTAARALEDIL